MTGGNIKIRNEIRISNQSVDGGDEGDDGQNKRDGRHPHHPSGQPDLHSKEQDSEEVDGKGVVEDVQTVKAEHSSRPLTDQSNLRIDEEIGDGEREAVKTQKVKTGSFLSPSLGRLKPPGRKESLRLDEDVGDGGVEEDVDRQDSVGQDPSRSYYPCDQHASQASEQNVEIGRASCRERV